MDQILRNQVLVSKNCVYLGYAKVYALFNLLCELI